LAVLRRFRLYLLIGLCFMLPFTWRTSNASAQELTHRGITLSDATPGATSTDMFSFTYTSTTSVGSVLFEFCTSPVDGVTCDSPVGLDATNAYMSLQTGEGGFSIFDTTTNQIYINRIPATTGQTPSTYTFNGIVNPSAPAGTYYARIYTFATIDGTGPHTDFGGMATSTTPNVQLTSIVPPILFFCVGVTITGTDCSTATGNLVDLGILNSSVVSSGTSQMVAATNAQFGLVIAADGTTMTSGTNIITSLSIPTVSAPGNSQFGFNLRANSDPNTGQDPNGPGVANPAPGYDIPNEYTFNPGDVVATSPAVTNYRKFTSSYVVNVPPNQSPGVYTATITYICTASF
jgi:hypothetical protein